MTNLISLAKDDIRFLSDAVTKVAWSNLKGIGKRQLQLTNQLEEHVNTLTEAINEVQNTIEAKTYNVDPNDTLVTPLLLMRVKIDVHSWALEIGTQEYDYVVHVFETMSIDFSKLSLAEVYAIQHAYATEIEIREKSLAY